MPDSALARQTFQPERVAVFRALKLGDMLCSVPAFRAMRHAWPSAEITLIGLPWACEFAQRLCAYVDRFEPFPGHPDLPEQKATADAFESFTHSARERRYDLALQMHGSGEITNGLVVQLGAAQMAGFHPADQASPDRGWFLPWIEQESETCRNLRLLEHLGIVAQGDHLEFPLTDADWDGFHQLARTYGLASGRYACVHPGASVVERRWDAAGFASVAEELGDRGLRVVITGNAAEIGLAEQIARGMRHRPIITAGQTSLGVLAALLREARLLVCNDTGVSHLAAATRTPSVVITPVSDPRRWAPLDRNRHRVVDARQGATVADVVRQIDALTDSLPESVAGR